MILLNDMLLLLLLLLLLIWQSPGQMPGWWKVNLITVTRRPLHPSIAAGLYCLTTSPGFLPALCEKWSGFFYVHRVWLPYTQDRRLKVSSEKLGNEDKAPCPRALLPGRGSNRGPPVWKSEVLTARPRQLLDVHVYLLFEFLILWAIIMGIHYGMYIVMGIYILYSITLPKTAFEIYDRWF